jgi:hypothetical protein
VGQINQLQQTTYVFIDEAQVIYGQTTLGQVLRAHFLQVNYESIYINILYDWYTRKTRTLPREAISEILAEEGRLFMGQINQPQQTTYVFIDEAHSKLLPGLTSTV